MPKQNAPLLAFNRGIVSPKALCRTDVPRIAWSSEEQSNWVPHTLGSMMLRPGFGYLLNTGSARPRYLPFVYAIDDTGLLEFTDGELRIIVDDEALSFDPVSASVTNGDFSPDVSGWTDADDSGAASVYAGTAGSVVALSDRTVYDYDEPGGTATAKFKLDNDGVAYTMRDVLDGSSYQAISGEWKLSGAAADYECRATLVSGTLSSGTTGSWLGNGTDREWTVSSSGSLETAVVDVEIRLTGTTTALVTGRITLKARAAAFGGGGGGGGGIIP